MTDQTSNKRVRKMDMEVQQVREMCEAAGPNGYIAMSCRSMLRVLTSEYWIDDDEIVEVAVAVDEEEDPFA